MFNIRETEEFPSWLDALRGGNKSTQKRDIRRALRISAELGEVI